jgi:hypothetical protein
MKGQYRIINEILLFGITAGVVFSVAGVIAFATESMRTQTQKEQYTLMGDLASLALTKSYICGKLADCVVTSEIPDRLSEDRYTLTLYKGKITVTNFETGESVDVSTLDFRTNTGGFITSNGRYFLMSNENDTILLTR